MKSFKLLLAMMMLSFACVATIGCGPTAVEGEGDGGLPNDMTDEEYSAKMNAGNEEAKQQGDGSGY